MARYSIHPADSGGHYHDIKLYKDRRATFEQVKEQQRLKKLKKKRRKGGIMWQFTRLGVFRII